MTMAVDRRPPTVHAAASDAVGDDDPVIRDWLAYMDAAQKPHEELVRDSIRTVVNLQENEFLTEAEVTELIKRIAAAQVQLYLSNAICHFLDPDVIHGQREPRWRWLSTITHRHHFHPAK